MLVNSHLRVANELAAGVASLPSAGTAFAATQGAWRFLNNERIALTALVAPLQEVGRQRAAELEAPFALLVHDWSKLGYEHPRRKRDLTQLTHEHDIGYELTTALLVSADDGQPLAPMEMHVETAAGVLYRPAKKNVRGHKHEKPGRPLELRWIVVQLRNSAGKLLAQWLLLTNAPAEWATAELLASCYYWRWRIESFFKLLKSHGRQLEHWLPETGPAIARRMLIAAMACVMVWQLQADSSPAATRLKEMLVRLSGRQTKRTKPHTAPALLAGLWVLLSFCALLEQYDLRDIKRLARLIPFRDTG